MLMAKKLFHDMGQSEKILYNTVPMNDHTANVPRRIVMVYTQEVESLAWLATVESLHKHLTSTTTLLMEFFKLFFLSEESHHLTLESTEHIAETSDQDLIFGVTRSTFITLKHTSLGLGLRIMVG